MYTKSSLLKEYSRYSNHLGNFVPYITNNNLFLNIENAIKNMNVVEIDIAGIIEMISFSHMLGDRTLIKNVKKLSWMTDFNDKKSYALCANLPVHKNNYDNSVSISIKFKKLLKAELRNYVKNKEKVGIFLSGGLDSRILAGLMKELQDDGIFNGEVISITWGIETSRDVRYAKEIATRYGWEFNNIRLTSDVLKNNIYITGKMGAEYSPYHLHAMPLVLNIPDIDAIVAGSYGDGVGRAEFSGKHILNLKPVYNRVTNPFGILKQKVIEKYEEEILKDAYEYREHITREKDFQFYEIEQELHYMRRKLYTCMSVVGQTIPVYQIFTKPDVFGYIWSLSPKIRTDDIYKHILTTLPGEVVNIPWARDGKSINDKPSIIIDGDKEHHKYGLWLRKDLYEDITTLVLSDEIRKLNVFNMEVLEKLIGIWSRQNTNTINKLDEILSWIASLSIFLRNYNVINTDSTIPLTIADNINYLKGPLSADIFLKLRSLFRD